MAIHFMALVQAIDYLKLQPQMAEKTRTVYNEIRAFFPVFTDDTPKYREIEAMITYLKSSGKRV